MVGKKLQIALVISHLICLGWGLKIMSFNVKDFGDQRFQEQNVTNIIVKASLDFSSSDSVLADVNIEIFVANS